MKTARIETIYIIGVWILVVTLFGTVMYMGYRRNTEDLNQIMMNEARWLVDIVSISAEAGIHALDEVEDLTARRLSDNARLIDHLALRGIISRDLLERIARENDLQMINILDDRGRSVMRSSPEAQQDMDMEKKHRPAVQSVLAGKSDEEVIGFMEDSYYSGKRYGVVVKGHDSGAVVVNTDSKKMLDFRRSVGLGTLFREIGLNEGVRYVVLQDTLGIVAASEGVTEMTRLRDDTFLVRADKGDWGVRTIRNGSEGTLEVVHPLIVDDVNLGIIRLGLSTEAMDAIRHRALRQFLILFFASVFSGAFVFFFAILRQNYLILNAEHDRILRDVRMMEEQTRRSERLASMGRLAAGVAHEIRNPLNSISIIAQRLKSEFTTTRDENEFAGLLSTVSREIARISTIVDNFLRYARPPELVLTRVRVGELISEILGIVGEKARSEDITVTTDIEPDLASSCDADQMKQAILNVVLNALDATPKQGTVFIRARKHKGGIAVEVQDTGSGIPDENLPKIFDPYFTTKANGTGLGLSEVHRIVTAHGGRITAENGVKGGAVFTITLPPDGEKS
ncbi:hypothetical protein LLG96_18850 [bacterium]|nr:hypothetical protein [bacterium]